MPNYSLIHVDEENGRNPDGTINGTWLQDCSGTTLDAALNRARETEKANSNRFDVAVVDAVPGTTLIGTYHASVAPMSRQSNQ